jgi:hypothetical protein
MPKGSFDVVEVIEVIRGDLDDQEVLVLVYE